MMSKYSAFSGGQTVVSIVCSRNTSSVYRLFAQYQQTVEPPLHPRQTVQQLLLPSLKRFFYVRHRSPF